MSDYTTQNTPCYVYFATTSNGYTKIGISTNIEARLSGLQIGNPDEIQIFTVIRFSSVQLATQAELMLHKKYAKYRKNGEWFSLDCNQLFDEISWFMRFVALIKDETPIILEKYNMKKQKTINNGYIRKSKASEMVYAHLEQYPEDINLTYIELAEKIGVGKSTVGNVIQKIKENI